MTIIEYSNLNCTSEQIIQIVDDLAQLRLLADIELAPLYPYNSGKTYPLGRCKEIRDHVFSQLTKVLPNTQQSGLILIRQEIAKGVVLKKIWGSLRDEYFQNAMQLGDWYIDVSNDTVNPNKPRVEILPLASSGFSAISSFEQFVAIAKSYWGVQVFRNDVCPALAPFMPLLFVAPNGATWLGAAIDDMLALAMDSQFGASESILSTLPQPSDEVIQHWGKALNALTNNQFLRQQGNSFDFCKEYRNKQCHQDSEFRDKAVSAFLQLPNINLKISV